MASAQLHAADLDIGGPEIIRQLTNHDGLPREALRAAADRRAEMVPLFIAEIDKFLAADFDRDTTPTPLFFIFHLLGDWRETAAYRPLARLLRCNSDDIDAAIGDAITTTSHRVMAAVFDGDPQPLYDIVLDPAADEFVRAHMCQALVMLVIEGRLPREGVESFLRSCFTSLEPQGTNFVWDGWQQAIAALAMSDMALLVRQAFDNEFIDPQSTDFHYFEKDLRHALDHPDDPWAGYGGDHTLFGDTIEELSKWSGFSEQYEKDRKRRRTQNAVSLDPGLPVVNPFRKVGRNEPCPCGSGKKFKKCCLQ